MKTKTELPKIDIATIADQMQKGRATLMEDAAHFLGYRTTAPTSLLQKLIALEISPFVTLAVTEYKKGKEKETMYSGTKGWLIWFFTSISILGGSLYGLHHYNCDVLFIVTSLASGFSTVVVSFSGAEIVGTGHRTVTKWTRTNIGSFPGPIPDHVLQKAIEVKKAHSDLYLCIDYLTSTTEESVRLPDPFLVVTDHEKEYYIEQWDERDFPTLEE